jgi:exodeoxyribonuclease VII small subunit
MKITYKEAYEKLELIAKEVETLDLSDLDRLVEITEEAAKYTRLCKSRIDVIKSKLRDNSNLETPSK